MATLTSVAGQWLSVLHSPPDHKTREQGKCTGLDAAKWAACPGTQPTGAPLTLVGLSCHLLCLLLECDLPLQKTTLSRVRGLCLHLPSQINKPASISSCKPPRRSPGTSARCRGVVSTDFRPLLSAEKGKHCGTTPSLCKHHI